MISIAFLSCFSPRTTEVDEFDFDASDSDNDVDLQTVLEPAPPPRAAGKRRA